VSDVHLLDHAVADAFYGHFPSLKDHQESAIRPILEGGNMVLSSGTGSGKTEAVLAPLVSLYWRKALQRDSLTMVYIAPTKALVNNLEKRIQPPLHKLGLRLGIRHGDRDDLSSGKIPHVLITTPESLEVLLFRKEKALQSISAMIIDEVHLLYNTQRGFQLSILIERLREIVGSIQWVALSATVGSLENVRDFLVGKIEETSFLEYPSQRSIISHVRHIKDEDDFLSMMQKLINGRPMKLLVFANARRECERLAGILHTDKSISPFVFAHYSSLSTDMRLKTEQEFSSSKTAICIATSTLELGIDIGDIDAVVLWGVPPRVESFLQRIGRSNRRLNKTNAICLVPDTSSAPIADALRFLALIKSAQKGELPILDPYELFGAAGQQCLSMIASNNGRYTRIADMVKYFEHTGYLNRKSLELVLAELANQSYLKRHDFKNRYGADEKIYELVDYKMIYGNFGLGSHVIDVKYDSQILGAVPSINLLRIKPGMSVRFAGRAWMVRKSVPEAIYLQPTTSGGKGSIVDFTYPGGGIVYDAFLCDRMWKILHEDALDSGMFEPMLYEQVSEAFTEVRRACQIDQIPYFTSHNGFCYYTFAGYLVNKAIKLITCQLECEENDLSIRPLSKIKWEDVPKDAKLFESIFADLFEMNESQSIYQRLLPMEYQLHEYLQEWLKDQTIPQILKRLNDAKTVQVNPKMFEPFSVNLMHS
jgi:ATP-dependent Lhr-like helicase